MAGYLESLKLLIEHYPDMPISESFILKLHQNALAYSHKDEHHKGRYKFGSNRVEAKDQDGKVVGVIFDPTPPYLVKKEMHELVDWYAWAIATKVKHPLILIANFIFEYLAIHPFQDGNGRTSRLITILFAFQIPGSSAFGLQSQLRTAVYAPSTSPLGFLPGSLKCFEYNLMLLQHGYMFSQVVSHERIIEDNKMDYYIALNRTQTSWKTDAEDITPWLLFFLNVIHKQSRQALKILKGDEIEPLLSEKQLALWRWANERNLEFSRRDPTFRTSI